MALSIETEMMIKTVLLSSLCRVFRSKNASPFLTTIDMFFETKENYDLARNSAALTPKSIAACLRLPENNVLGIHTQDEALGIKVSIIKHGGYASGDPENADVFGAQQYIPMLDLPIEVAT